MRRTCWSAFADEQTREILSLPELTQKDSDSASVGWFERYTQRESDETIMHPVFYLIAMARAGGGKCFFK